MSSPVSKGAYICAQIEALEEVLPGAGLRRLHEKVHYTAPEMLDTLWLEVYAVLMAHPVVPEARDIWNAACRGMPAR